MQGALGRLRFELPSYKSLDYKFSLEQIIMKPTAEPTTLTAASFEDLVREMIVRLGEDPNREGLTRTPGRVQRAMEFLTKGYKENPELLLKDALFTDSYDEMVIVKAVEMLSLCEQHLLPLYCKVQVPYIPNAKINVLSKSHCL